ncbi:MAG: ferredoxin family protein [bacterium]|nr:ferredoxin family protein [bacterium]
MAESSTTTGGRGSKQTKAPKKAGRVSVIPERCKGCGYCVEFCPLNVLVMSSKFNAKGYHYPEVANGQKCSGCDLCGMYCPDFAVHGYRQPPKE